MMPLSYAMTIGGKAAAGPAYMPVIDPATGRAFAEAPVCSGRQLAEAVESARRAFPDWQALSYAERGSLVASIADILEANVEDLKRLLTWEQGKPLSDAAGEIMRAAFWCRATAALDVPVQLVEDNAQRRGEIRRVPLGVVGAIAPWNYPVVLAMFKIAPALLTGNTVVLKPSPYTPLTTLRIGELLREALPPGVLNVVSGGDELGPWLTDHPDIQKISFTGSTDTGRKVMASAARTMKRVTLELGGNDPAIVLPDVDIEVAARQVFWAAFRNNGQICMGAKRVYVHDGIYERFKSAIVDYAKTVKTGPGHEDGVELGPVQNLSQLERVRDLIDDARRQGCSFALEQRETEGAGYFAPVTIIDNPPDDSRIVQEEQFGPIMPLLRYSDTDDVVRRANASRYGLCASIWSQDLDLAARIATRIEAGTIWVNEAHYIAANGVFGGHKESGLGVEGGIEGLLEFTNPRTIFVRKPAPA